MGTIRNCKFWSIAKNIKILKYYNARHSNKKIELLHKNLKFVKNIRNTCAHNNIFLINLYDKSLFIKNPNGSVGTFASNMNINRDIIQHGKLHDLLILFYFHSRYCSKSLNSRRYNEGLDVLNRMNRKKHLYVDSNGLKGFFKYFKVLLDNFKRGE